MNTDWNDLIQRYIAGHTTEEETRRLEAALKADDVLADLYLRHMELDVALEASAASAEVTRELLTAPALPETRRSFAWLSWRPLTAAAAGIVFGMFCTSMVWALAAPSAGRKVERSIPLLAEGFEDARMVPKSSFPSGANQWAGDLSAPVGALGNVKPAEGGRMVRLIPKPKLRLSYARYIFDLAEHPAAAAGGPVRIEISAAFSAADAARSSHYQIRLAAFSEAPANVRAIWNNEAALFDTVLQHVGRNVLTKPGDTGWQTVQAVMQIPPGTRSVVISLGAGEGDPAQPKADHYLDDVQANFVITQAPE